MSDCRVLVVGHLQPWVAPAFGVCLSFDGTTLYGAFERDPATGAYEAGVTGGLYAWSYPSLNYLGHVAVSDDAWCPAALPNGDVYFWSYLEYGVTVGAAWPAIMKWDGVSVSMVNPETYTQGMAGYYDTGYQYNGLSYSPVDGYLWSVARNQANDKRIWRINPSTGAFTTSSFPLTRTVDTTAPIPTGDGGLWWMDYESFNVNERWFRTTGAMATPTEGGVEQLQDGAMPIPTSGASILYVSGSTGRTMGADMVGANYPCLDAHPEIGYSRPFWNGDWSKTGWVDGEIVYTFTSCPPPTSLPPGSPPEEGSVYIDQQMGWVIRLDGVVPYRTPDLAPVTTDRPVPTEGWTAPGVWIQTEPEPQWNTLGSGLTGTAYGPGTDDAIAYPLESAPAASGITAVSDYWTFLSTPARSAMCIAGEDQWFEDVPEYWVRKVYFLYNSTAGAVSRTLLTLFPANDTEVLAEYEEQEILPAGSPADGLAVALVNPNESNNEVLCFTQSRAGDVICTPVLCPRESKYRMGWPHYTSTGRPGILTAAMSVRPAVSITSGGYVLDRAAWIPNGFEGGNIFFNSLQAVSLEGNRVLLLHLKSDGSVTATIVTSGGVAGTPVVVGTNATNLYQAVTADNGRINGDRNTVVFTYRRGGSDALPPAAQGGGEVVVLNCASSPTVTATATVAATYTHAAWCANRIVVLAKPAYEATSQSTLGFGASSTDLLVFSETLSLLNTVAADQDLVADIQQTGTVYGFANGRLFMHCSSYVGTQNDVGNVYEYDGGGVRLWILQGDNLVLQDQISEGFGTQPSSTTVHRLAIDSLVTLGPTGETYDFPPGDEAPQFVSWFVGGVFKEANSDVQLYRLSDNWVYVIEPEKNGIWATRSDAYNTVYPTANADINSIYARAVHIDDEGIPDMVGEPEWLYAHNAWYSAAVRIDDTRFIHAGRALNLPQTQTTDTGQYKWHWRIQVLQVDETTGNLCIAFDLNIPIIDVGDGYSSDGHGIIDNGVGWIGRIEQIDQALNRYIMMYRSDPNYPGTALEGRIRTFVLNADYSATILDDKPIVGADTGGGLFTERKPDGLTMISPTSFVATWPNTVPPNGAHYSSHAGVVVDATGQITVGQPILGGPSLYGYQGVWMHEGCANGGRYIYPVSNVWPYTERYPNVPYVDEVVVGFNQSKAPFALAAMTVDPVTADLTVEYYVLRVDPDTIDREWYDENFFFYPEPPVAWDLTRYQAHPGDGALYLYWDISQALPGSNADEVWMFGGPNPTPWIWGHSGDTLNMAKYVLADGYATYVPDTFDIHSVPYHTSYQQGSIVLREGLFAMLGTTGYYSRASPTGYSAGFGTNVLRMWAVAGPGRGAAVVDQHSRSVVRYPKTGPRGGVS